MTAGVPRLNEIGPYVEELLEVVDRESVDYVFHLGDLFDPGTMLGAHYAATVIEIAAQINGEARAGSVWIAGNHDVIESSLGSTTISPLAAAVAYGDTGARANVWVFERPGAARLSLGADGAGVALLALPYVARAVERTSGFAHVYEDAFVKAARFAEELPLVVIGHLTVPGALVGSETYDMPRGRDVDFPFEAVAALKPAFVANGHYHKAQTVQAHGLTIVIPGSPHRLTFGERDDTRKGFTVIEIPT